MPLRLLSPPPPTDLHNLNNVLRQNSETHSEHVTAEHTEGKRGNHSKCFSFMKMKKAKGERKWKSS